MNNYRDNMNSRRNIFEFLVIANSLVDKHRIHISFFLQSIRSFENIIEIMNNIFVKT